MSIRRLIVEVSTEGLNVRQFCVEHRVSTWFFYDLRRRHARDGDVVLEPMSRAPHEVANKTPAAVEEAIVAKRKDLADAGLDAGPESIRFHLRALPAVPSPSTIYRILKARGFVTPAPAKAPKGSRRRFTAERANECWGLDDTTWELVDGTEVKILNVIDDHSRLLVASTAMATCTGAATLAALAQAAEVLGWPTRFLSDNAKAFRHVLADALRPIGVAAGHSRPYHPQTNGKVERFHQTLKKWLRRQPAATSLDDLQHQLDVFRVLYNHERPHRGVGRQFPAVVWTDAPKAGPADRPLGTPSTIHHSTVANGTCNAGRYSISVGAAHNGETALIVITGLACHVFHDGRLIRAFTLDPTRRVQPLHPRPGRPAKL
jgi:transposase InsO family protein